MRYIAREIYANLPRPAHAGHDIAIAASISGLTNIGASNASTALSPRGPRRGTAGPTWRWVIEGDSAARRVGRRDLIEHKVGSLTPVVRLRPPFSQAGHKRVVEGT